MTDKLLCTPFMRLVHPAREIHRSIMHISLSALVGFIILTWLAIAPAAQSEELAKNLVNTAWTWRHNDDVVNVGGQQVLRDGAWTEVRFRSNGKCSAWHYDAIVYEGNWEVMSPRSIRIKPRKDVGLVLNFHDTFKGFTVVNEDSCVGAFKGRLPWPSAAVGRWRWPNGAIITLREDGYASSSGGTGRWKMLSRERFEINWREGGYIDSIRIMSGNNKLKCKNQAGKEWQAERAVESSS
jgi:hypothetical protein